MSRPSLNSNLTALARRAGELRFDDSPIAFGQFQNRKVPRDFKHKNCYAVPQGWAVKQYIGGSQRTLGLFRNADEYHATRFADLCIVHFWQYRKTRRAITDSDLNYTLEIAESARVGAQSLLDQIERFLCQRFQINARVIAAPVPPAPSQWQDITTLDRTKMDFVLVANDGVVRLQLWNPDRQCWERPYPFGSPVSDGEECSNPTHWMPCPEAPNLDVVPGTKFLIPIIYKRKVADPVPAPGPVTISPLFNK